MNPKVVAEARRLYHHVLHGGTLRPEDVSFMVKELEKAEWLGSVPRMNIAFPERYKEQYMKTIQLVDEQVDEIVIQELKGMYDNFANNIQNRLNGIGGIYMDNDKNKDIAIMRDMMRSISMVLDFMGVQYGE